MKEKLRSFYENNGVLFMAYALSLTLSMSVFEIYNCNSAIPFWILFSATALYCAVLYCICSFVNKHHFLGGMAITILLLIIARLFTMFSRMGLSRYEVGFLEWLLTKGSEVDNAFFYMLGLFVFFPTFLSITIFYFSKALYRMFFLTLLSLIPCVLYVKVLANINNIYLVLIALLNVGIFIMHQKRNPDKIRTIGSLTSAVSSLTFILLLFFVTAFIPKVTETPYYDDFEDMFMGGDTSSDISSSFSELGDHSGDAGGFFSISNRKLYTLAGDNTPYLKRQNFDYYDFDKHYWYADKEYASNTIPLEEWQPNYKPLNLAALHKALLRAENYEPGFLASHGFSEEFRNTKIQTEVLKNVRIQAENFSAIYYLSTVGTVNLYINRDETCYATPSGTFYSESTPHGPDFSYSLEFYDEQLSRSIWINNGGTNFSNEEAGLLLSDLNKVLNEHEDLLVNTVTAYLRQHVNANYYGKLCEENNALIPAEIKNLALEITKGKESDYEKALALQNYFHTGEFVYDLGYRAPTKDPVYFLTESKRGTCSDYATAFTLMARSIGLTVRYAEGYVPEHGEMYWQYTIKSKNSHAYPEVFIPNMGWTVFEPTASIEDTTRSSFHSLFDLIKKLRMDYGLMAVVAVFLIALSVLLFLLRLVLPFMAECIFRIRLRFLNERSACILAYGRIVKKCLRRHLTNADKKTPYEMAEFLSSIGCDIHPMCYALEKLLYARKAPLPDRTLIQNSYKNASKAIARFRKI